MSYAGYVIGAYGVFVVVLLWDFVAPRIRTRQLLRAVQLLARRQAAATPAATQGELKR
jgi:heme exporter protein D